jgi:threonine dehydrogenase-like Zn-dependent dehydrogenase
VVVPFTIACGGCFFCKQDWWAFCDNSNPNAWMAETLYGSAPAAVFGYSHMYGGYAGGQAQYVRVPFADVGPLQIPPELDDLQVLFLSDILPTGYMAAENCNIRPGDVVAVWGCGPVGQFAIRSARLLGAADVIAIDRFEERLTMARAGGAQTVNYAETPDLLEEIKQRTGGRGPDACIDAVGMEAHGHGLGAWYDSAKMAVRLATDRSTALRQAIQACRKGGVVSVPGVYGGFLDKMPFGAIFNKGLTIRAGQTHVQRYLGRLLEHIQSGAIDTRFLPTHWLPIEEAPRGYQMFRDKADHCVKVVLDPHAAPRTSSPPNRPVPTPGPGAGLRAPGTSRP